MERIINFRQDSGTIISAFFVGFTLRQINNLYTYITGREVKVVK